MSEATKEPHRRELYRPEILVSFKITVSILLLFYLYVCYASCVCEHYVHAWFSWRLEEVAGTRVTRWL